MVGYKWIFKKKKCTLGIKEAMYKSWLVANIFTDVEGIGYNEIFSLTVKYCSIRALTNILNHYNHELKQIDVNIDFLYR